MARTSAAVLQLGKGAFHADEPGLRIDVELPKCAQLASSQAGEGGQHDERAIPGVNRLAKLEDLADGQHHPLSRCRGSSDLLEG